MLPATPPLSLVAPKAEVMNTRCSVIFRTLLFLAVLVLGTTAKSYAAFDMFIKIGDLKGESRDKTHASESDVFSWSWGMSKPAPVGGGGAGKVWISNLNLQKSLDTSSPGLMTACAKGEHFDRAILTIRTVSDKPIEFYRIVLEEVVVTSVSTGGADGQDRLIESVSLAFQRVGVQYFSITRLGDLGTEKRFTWDLVQNLPGTILFPGDDTGPIDSDGDGLPDDWEIAHNLNPQINDRDSDADDDGATNYEELIAGTDPQSKDQVFKASFDGAAGASNGNLTWTSTAGKQYRILVADSLGSPFELYTTITSAGDGSTSIPFPTNLGKQFFKIEVVP
jgi:type VI secretion system secreted protein Hcp